MDENVLHNWVPPFQACLQDCALHQKPNNQNNHPVRKSKPKCCVCKGEEETQASVRIYFL